MELSTNEKKMLEKIAEATKSEKGFGMFGIGKVVETLKEQGFIEINATVTEGVGTKVKTAMRITDVGVVALSGGDNVAEAVEAPVEESAEVPEVNAPYPIETGVPMPKIKRSGRGPSKYPFDEMPDPQFDEAGKVIENTVPSFFVAPTEKMPDPAKTMPSTCASATRRWSEPCPEGATKMRGGVKIPAMIKERHFKSRPEANGARIYRVK